MLTSKLRKRVFRKWKYAYLQIHPRFCVLPYSYIPYSLFLFPYLYFSYLFWPEGLVTHVKNRYVRSQTHTLSQPIDSNAVYIIFFFWMATLFLSSGNKRRSYYYRQNIGMDMRRRVKEYDSFRRKYPDKVKGG